MFAKKTVSDPVADVDNAKSYLAKKLQAQSKHQPGTVSFVNN